MRQGTETLIRRGAQCLTVGLALLVVGCKSSMVMIAPDVPATVTKLGPTEGSAAGALVSPGIGTAYYFVPVMLNSRVQRAYDDALARAPGATALTSVTLQENWYWWVFGCSRHVTITGEAVR